MYTLEELLNIAQYNYTKVNGVWVSSRPLVGPWITRLKAAWEVFRGRADAIKWPEGQ